VLQTSVLEGAAQHHRPAGDCALFLLAGTRRDHARHDCPGQERTQGRTDLPCDEDPSHLQAGAALDRAPVARIHATSQLQRAWTARHLPCYWHSGLLQPCLLTKPCQSSSLSFWSFSIHFLTSVFSNLPVFSNTILNPHLSSKTLPVFSHLSSSSSSIFSNLASLLKPFLLVFHIFLVSPCKVFWNLPPWSSFSSSTFPVFSNLSIFYLFPDLVSLLKPSRSLDPYYLLILCQCSQTFLIFSIFFLHVRLSLLTKPCQCFQTLDLFSVLKPCQSSPALLFSRRRRFPILATPAFRPRSGGPLSPWPRSATVTCAQKQSGERYVRIRCCYAVLRYNY